MLQERADRDRGEDARAKARNTRRSLWLRWPACLRKSASWVICFPVNMVRYYRQESHVEGAVCEEVARQLSERPRRVNSDIGQPDCDETTRRVFLTLEKIILTQLGWPKTQLTWCDPMNLLLHEPHMDLGAVYANEDIRDTFGVHFEVEDYTHIHTLSVGEFSALIASRATKVPLSPDAYKAWDE